MDEKWIKKIEFYFGNVITGRTLYGVSVRKVFNQLGDARIAEKVQTRQHAGLNKFFPVTDENCSDEKVKIFRNLLATLAVLVFSIESTF